MLISSRLNRLLRGVIKEYRDQFVATAPEEMKPYAEHITQASMKEILSDLNPDFPVDEKGKKLSFTKISNREACQHLEFIFMIGGEKGFTFRVNEEEWARIMESVQ